MSNFRSLLREITDIERTSVPPPPFVAGVSSAGSIEEILLETHPDSPDSEAVLLDDVSSSMMVARPQKAAHNPPAERKAREIEHGALRTVHMSGFLVSVQFEQAEQLREAFHRHLESMPSCIPVGKNGVLDISRLVDSPEEPELDEFRIAALGQILGIWRVISLEEETPRERAIRAAIPDKVSNSIEGYKPRPNLAQVLAKASWLQPALGSKWLRWWSRH